MIQAKTVSPMQRNPTNYRAASAAVCRAILLAVSLNLTMHARAQIAASEWRMPSGIPFVCSSLAHTNWPVMPGPSCEDCFVYSLGTNGQGVACFLADDVEYWAARESELLSSANRIQSYEP